jgi:hypothetical protein
MPFTLYAENSAVREARGWRDQDAHREHLGYLESPGFGRTSKMAHQTWRSAYPSLAKQDDTLPFLAERRDRLVEADQALLEYADSVWRTVMLFFGTVGVHISDERDEGRVQARVRPGGPPTAPPREQRDPGPLLIPRAP